MKDPFDLLIGKPDITRKKICELEDISIGITQTKMLREKGVNEME